MDIDAIARKMPVIGINDSWRRLETPWRVFADAWDQGGPRPRVGFIPWSESPRECPREIPPNHAAEKLVLIPWLHRQPGEEPRFMGFELDRGTFAYFSGMIALEVAAWCGYDRIVLLGYDCAGTHFYDKGKETPGGAGTHAIWRRQLEEAKAILGASGVSVTHTPPLDNDCAVAYK